MFLSKQLLKNTLSRKTSTSAFKQLKSMTQMRQATFATSQSQFYDILCMDETRSDLREMVEKFATEECEPIADEMDKTMNFPRDMWPKLGDMGLLGITVEEEFGGAGLGYYEHCLVVEELSKANAGLALSYLAHSNLCVNQIRLNGT